MNLKRTWSSIPASLNPHYSYSDEQNHTHQVWFLDAVTAYNELRASERLGVQGTALWRMGSSDTSIWPIWDATRPTTMCARNRFRICRLGRT